MCTYAKPECRSPPVNGDLKNDAPNVLGLKKIHLLAYTNNGTGFERQVAGFWIKKLGNVFRLRTNVLLFVVRLNTVKQTSHLTIGRRADHEMRKLWFLLVNSLELCE